MGQISSPLSMRYSKSMQWPTLWGDKLNFNKKTKEDVFINTILPLIFNQAVYLNKYTNTNNTIHYLNSIFLNPPLFLKNFYENIFFKFKLSFLTINTLTPFFLSFFGKLWIVRFNAWLILIIYVYSPKKIGKIVKNQYQLSKRKNYKIWKLMSNTKLLSEIKTSTLISFH